MRLLLAATVAVACDSRAGNRPADDARSYASAAATQTLRGRTAQISPAAFVQAFYDWYLPMSREQHGDPRERALRARANDFSPALAGAIQAELKAAGGAVGALDADPFLASQDPCERYVTGAVHPHGAGYAVDVYGVCGGTRNARPDVIAELVPVERRWLFANFRYPELGTDLLRMLLRTPAEGVRGRVTAPGAEISRLAPSGR